MRDLLSFYIWYFEKDPVNIIRKGCFLVRVQGGSSPFYSLETSRRNVWMKMIEESVAVR